MSEPNIGAIGGGPPSIVHPEPLSSEPPRTEPLACVDPAAGSGGASGAGAEALVRRFSGAEGAGPSLEPAVVPPDGPSCGDDALRAVGACGVVVLAGTTTAGVGALVAGLGCAGALGGYIECLATADEAANPKAKP
jgi:hypothetical protein